MLQASMKTVGRKEFNAESEHKQVASQPFVIERRYLHQLKGLFEFGVIGGLILT